MKSLRIFVLIFSVIIFTNSYCFTASPMQKEEMKQNLELSGRVENGVRIIEITASRYKFVPDPVVVKLGDKVRIVVTSADVTHGYSLPEFKVNFIIKPGEVETAEFIADKKGKFHVYCSIYCGPGHGQMQGEFIVIK